MIRAIIIDDEPKSIKMLQWMLDKHCQEVEVVASFTNPEEALAKVNQLEPRLVFLDIEMPQMSGFDLLEKLKPFSFDVLFTTSYNQFAIKAFKFSAVDYLLKPIDADDLRQAISRYMEHHNTAEVSEKVDALLTNLKLIQNPAFTRIAVSTQESTSFIPVNDIIRCESDGNYTHVITTTKQHLVSKTLKEFDEMLSGRHFYRVHASHLINLQHMEKLVKGEGGYIVMSDKSSVPISRAKKEEFMEVLGRL